MLSEKDILVEQLQNIAARLLEEGKKMDSEPLIIGYDNGGGQSGIRENPYYPAYEKLLSSYTKGLAALREAGGQKEIESSGLDAIRSKFKVAK